jgi:hypothetical protein
MAANLVLLDVIPGPPGPRVGTGELIFIAIVVLMLTGAAVVGFVFLLRWLVRAKSPVTQTSSRASAGFQPNSPNQP